jgi:hypothetical protein
LSRADQKAFERALQAGVGYPRSRAQLYGANGHSLSIPLTVSDGEVVVDATNHDSPTRTAAITLLDPDRLLMLDDSAPFSGGIWFSHSLRLTNEIWVEELGRWIGAPVFHGPISSFERYGDEVDVDAQGKEAQHLDPYFFFRSFTARRHWHVHRAIRELFGARGETEFTLDVGSRRMSRDRTWPAGAIPWKAGQHLADVVDRQLFYRGDGTLRLGPVPENPVWVFSEGKDSLLTDYPRDRLSITRVRNAVLIIGERTVKVPVKKHTTLSQKASSGDTSVFVTDNETFFDSDSRIEIGADDSLETRNVTSRSGHQVFFTGRALTRNHPKGAHVTVNTIKKETRPVVARDQLGQNHNLSPEALTGGKRPRIHIEERPGIHKRERAKERANKLMNRMKLGLEREISFSAVPVFHLEELDKVLVEIDGRRYPVRLERFTIPLHPEGTMDVNWLGRRVPRRRHHRGK